jgi:maltooligosyltrehalose trehalohydrolase
MLGWYRDLIRLRRSCPELRDGELRNVRVFYDEGARWLTMSRGRITLALSLASEPRDVGLSPASRLVLASDGAIALNGTSLRLPPDSVAIIETAT